MELTHTFTVPASVEDTWAAFGDIGSVAECFPGATVTSVDGDDFSGSCKVKLGPIALVYNGSGSFVERDEAAHRFVVQAKGKDKRGNGTAGATVTASMTAAGSDGTEVSVVTDLSITGKPAQFGRGVIQDVSDKLLTQFVDCLAGKVGRDEEPAEPAAHVHPDDVAASQVSAAAEAAAAGVPGVAAGGGTATGHPHSANDALDLGATMLPALARAYWKPVLGLLLALLVLRRLLSEPRGQLPTRRPR